MSTYDERKTPAEAWLFERQVDLDLHMFGATALVMGSLRRWNIENDVDRVIGDLDLMIRTDKPLTEVPLPLYLTPTEKKAHGWRSLDDHGRMMVDVWACPPESVGPFSMFLTGPMDLNVVMRQISQRAGLMLTQYGLYEPAWKPTKTYPLRMVPGDRVDRPEYQTETAMVAEECFWAEWCDATGVGDLSFPWPHRRERMVATLRELLTV